MSALRDIFSGTVWIVGARWAIRGIGLISTILLARLLTPTDFGVVAMALFVVGLVEVFGDTGMVLFIIRHPNPLRSHFDTVWSLRLLVGLALAAAMLLLAPAGGAFFGNPEVSLTIRVLALRPLLNGLENPGIIRFQKDMVFRKDFEFLVVNRIGGFIVTVTAAFILRDHWALVIGILSTGVISTLQSYRMHPYRPRFDLSRTREVWGYSVWILLQAGLGFLNQRVDELLVGHFNSAAKMGFYSVAMEVAEAPVQEIVMPLSRVLVPGIARVAHDRAAMIDTFQRVLSAVFALTLAIGAGIALVSGDFTRVFLGPRWLDSVPLIRVLAISASMFVLSQPLFSLLNAIGRSRAAATLSFVRLVLLVAAMVPAAMWFDVETIALARAAMTAVTILIALAVYVRLLEVRVGSVWACLRRPLMGVVVMAGVVTLVQHLSPDIPVLRLVLGVASGAVTYIGTLFLLWRAVGSPAGLEADIVALVTSWLRRPPRALRRPVR